MVNSDDRKLPDGADIIATLSSRHWKSKLHGFNPVYWYEHIFIMYQCKFNPPSAVTRQKIPTKMIQSWNFPKEHDNSSDLNSDEVGENSVGFNSNLCIFCSGPVGRLPKDIDTISISSDSNMFFP